MPDLFDEITKPKLQAQAPPAAEPDLFDEITKPKLGKKPKPRPDQAVSDLMGIRESTGLQVPFQKTDAPVRIAAEMAQQVRADAPMPKNIGEALRAALSRGLSIRHHPDLHQDIELKAQLMAKEAAYHIGSTQQGQIDTPDFIDLTNAYRYICTVAYSPLSPDEIPRAAKELVTTLTEKGLDLLNGKIQSLAAEGGQHTDRMHRYQQWFSVLKDWNSRADDVEIQRKFLGLAYRMSPQVLRPASEEGKAELRVATQTANWARLDMPPPSEAVKNAWANAPKFGTTLPPDMIFRQLFTDLQYPRAAATYVKDAWMLAQNRAKLRMLGLPDLIPLPNGRSVSLDQTSLTGALAYTHPTLVHDIIQRANKRDRDIPADRGGAYTPALEKYLRKRVQKQTALAFYDFLLDGRLENTRKRLQYFDPQETRAFEGEGGARRVVFSMFNEIAAPMFKDSMSSIGRLLSSASTGYSEIKQRLKDEGIIDFTRVPDSERHNIFGAIVDSIDSLLSNRPQTNDLVELREQLADGRMDPMTFMRVAAGHRKTGLLANLSFYAAAKLGGATVARRVQNLAKDAPEKLAVSTLIEMVEKERDKALHELLDKTFLIRDREMEMADNETARALREKRFWDWIGAAFRSTTFRIAKETRDALEFTVAQPNSLPLNVAMGYAMRPAIKGAKAGFAPVSETLVKAVQASRARRAMADLAYWSQEHAVKLRDALASVAFGKKTQKGQEASLRAAEAMADTVAENHRMNFEGLDEPTKASKKVQLADHVRRTRNVLQQVAPETLLEVVDEMGISQGLSEMIRRPHFMDLFKVISNEVTERLKLNKRKLHPEVAQSSENLARKIDELVDNGMTVEQALRQREALPFSLDGLDGGAGKLRNWVDGARNAFWDKFVRNRVAVKGGEVYRSLTEFATKHLAFMKEWRILQGLQRAHQVTILEYLNSRYTSELADLDMQVTAARAAGEEIPLDAANRLADLQSKATRTHNHSEMLDRRPWDQETRLSINDYARDLNLHDWDALLTELEPQGDRMAAFRRIKRKNEKLSNFNKKWEEALADPDKHPEFQQRVNAAMTKLYMDNSGMGVTRNGKLFIDQDIETGQIMLPADARRIHRTRKSTWDQLNRAEETIAQLEALDRLSKKQRAALERAERAREKAQAEIDQNPQLYDPATNFGFNYLDTPERLKSIRGWASAYQTQKVQGILSRFGEFETGSMKDGIQLIANTELSTRTSLHNQNYILAQQIEAYDNLTPEQKLKYNEAIEQWAEGNSKDIDAFARKHRNLFYGNHDPDTNILNLFKNSEQFRTKLLQEARDAELIDENTFKDWTEKYSPHTYETHEWNRMMREHNKDVEPERFFEDGTEAGTAAMDLSETLSQRDLARYRVVIQQKGGRQLSKKFDTEAEARDWLEAQHGVRKSQKLQGDTGVGGETQLGDPFKILEPVGLEAALRHLKLRKAGHSMGAQLNKLIRDIQMYKYLKSFDRHGWVMTEKQFSELRIENPRMGKDWIRMPNIRQFGPLRGKIVARPVARQIKNFVSIENDMTAMFKGLSDAMAPLHPVGSRLLSLADPATRVFRRFLTKNAISRNPLTIATNYIMDMQMFGRMAFGEDYMYHPDGKAARKFAFKALFNSKHGWAGTMLKAIKNPKKFRQMIVGRAGKDVEFDDALDEQIFLDAIEDGMLGDQLVTDVLGDNAKPALIRSIYGDPEGVPNTNVIDGTKSTYDHIKDALMVGDNPQIAALQNRVKEIDTLFAEHEAGLTKIAKSHRNAMEVERAGKLNAIEDLHREQILSKSPKAWVNTIFRLLGATEKKGLGGTAKSLSKEFYARTGNMVRLSGYHFLRRRGWSRAEAAKEVNKFTQHYSGVPKSVSALSKNPFGAAITSFPYEMARLTKNWLTERPYKYAAMLSAIPTANMFTLAAAGVDPYAVYDYMSQHSGGLPAPMAFATTLFLPTGTPGEVSTNSLTSISPFILWRSPYGILSGAVEREDLPDGIIGDAATLAINYFSKYILSQPLTSTVVNTARGRDPITGRRYSDKVTGAVENVKDLIALMVPPWAPWVGKNAKDLYEIPRRPPGVRTGQIATPTEAALQTLTGLRSRGGLFDRMADQVPGGRRALDTVTSIISRTASGGLQNPLPEYKLPPKGIGLNAHLNAWLWQGRKLDSSGEDFDTPLEPAHQDLRWGMAHIIEGTKEGDPKQVEFGKRIRDQALAALNERDTVRAKFMKQEFEFGPKRSKITQEYLPTKENVDAALGVLKSMDFQSLGRAGPITQTYVLVHAAASPLVTDDQLTEILHYMTRTPLGSVATSGDTRRLEQAEEMVNAYLQTRKHDNGLEQIKTFQAHLQYRKIMALRREFRGYWLQRNLQEAHTPERAAALEDLK